MNQIIKVDYSKDQPVVSARELHEFLEVSTPYHKWFPRMCEYGFTENQDFSVTDIFVHNSAGGPQTKKDAAITIDMAKELCMLQRNEKGKIARQYFIQLEKDWNSPEKVMARALQIAERQIKTLKTENAAQKEQIAEMEPKATYCETVLQCKKPIAITVIAKDYGWSGRRMNQELRKRGVQYYCNKTWVLNQKYADKGYTKTVTSTYDTGLGYSGAKIQTYWTQEGRMFIYELLKAEGILPIIEAA